MQVGPLGDLRVADRARQIRRKVSPWIVARLAPPGHLVGHPFVYPFDGSAFARGRAIARLHGVAVLAAACGITALRYGVSLHRFFHHDFDPACFAVNKARRARQLIVSDDGPAAPHWSRS